ncbi:tetratricopeptide repeat protein [Agrobacterium vitis]|nr:tetratricopeptide repeat protein [Agrobacterium vitis]NSZ53982.1 tetratricopeptide repeat protein [Agrobacterium vitis]NTA32740.1 tetratricopeptide repeat protein [Agrobacterium vitis]
MPPALPFTPDLQPEPNHPETGEPRADKEGPPPLSPQQDPSPQQGEVERLEDRSDTAALSGKPSDELLTQLKRERQPEAAKAIAAAVMADWSNSGSPTVNLLMQWADKAIKDKKNAAALDFLDQAIVLEPDYANGWGHRASLHYSQGNYRKAISDLNHVLAIEPRHFGALEMLANILAETGSDQKALEAWQRYLAIYPADRAAQKTVTELSEKLAGART